MIGIFLVVLAEQMFTYAIGWELYERTNSPLALFAPEIRRLGTLRETA
jgi:hypothetical protein